MKLKHGDEIMGNNCKLKNCRTRFGYELILRHVGGSKAISTFKCVLKTRGFEGFLNGIKESLEKRCLRVWWQLKMNLRFIIMK